MHNMAEEGRYHEEVFGVESRCSAQAVKYGSINALKLHVVAMSELIRGGDMEELSRALRVGCRHACNMHALHACPWKMHSRWGLIFFA